jgi:hypothetical protein
MKIIVNFSKLEIFQISLNIVHIETKMKDVLKQTFGTLKKKKSVKKIMKEIDEALDIEI